MLKHLHIQNIALIDKIDVDFMPGFNILTGETGAGKSIIIDAINLILGERADRTLITAGAQTAVVELTLEVATDGAGYAYLLAQELLDEQTPAEVFLSRTLSASGKNVCRINGNLVSLAVLKEFTAHIIDIHGQHEHQSLLNEDQHLIFLDGFLPPQAKEAVAEQYRQYHACLREIRASFGTEQDRARRLDMLEYQIKEISAANLSPTEETDLKQQRLLLSNAGTITLATDVAYAQLYTGAQGASALDAMGTAMREMESISQISKEFETFSARLTDVYYTLEDLCQELRAMRADMEFDPGELDRVELRLETITRLQRKYGNTVQEVLAFLENAKREKEDLENVAERLAASEKKRDEAALRLEEACAQLTQLRQAAAEKLQEALLLQLADLGMGKTQFVVQMQSGVAANDATGAGWDKVVFLLSVNPGQPLRPLARVASGGETSRLMLGFKSVMAQGGNIPTLIFDEIDTGISGAMAQTVGEKMAKLSAHHQVICVTHLPQIAALANTHFLVEKTSGEEWTKTHLHALAPGERVREVARMFAGEQVGQSALQHAQEMIEAGQRLQ